jgi:hypothetical protein
MTSAVIETFVAKTSFDPPTSVHVISPRLERTKDMKRVHLALATVLVAETSAQHLMTAVDHVRAAARSANHEYGNEIVGIYDEYAPRGYWDETIVFEKDKLASNLTTVQTELEKLAAKLKPAK